ncbi:MAG: hypothetical protein LBC07_01055 [Elusimicrobiota bacterium]|jgi:carbamoyltransferase|nr:hypothetical protein [Elusimicrobiota bacterium]
MNILETSLKTVYTKQEIFSKNISKKTSDSMLFDKKDHNSSMGKYPHPPTPEYNKNKNIIISLQCGHNATIGVSINGEIVCLLSEERLNRLKNSFGIPKLALQYAVKKYLNGDIKNADKIIYCGTDLSGLRVAEDFGFKSFGSRLLYPYSYTQRDMLLKQYIFYKRKFFKNTHLFHKCKSFIKKFIGKKRNEQGKWIFPFIVIRRNLINVLAEKIGCNPQDIIQIDHHISHILASLYFVNKDKKYLCFSIDGVGDGMCAKVGVWENSDLKILSTTSEQYSLGLLYSKVVSFLGMLPLEHEFKVMGMAPYAKPEQVKRVKEIFEEILQITSDGNFTSPITDSQHLNYIIDNLMFERFDNVSAGVQIFTEEILTKWVKFWIDKTGIKDITLGGGVMMNVKAVKKIYEIPEVNSVFITPSSGDESLAIGGLFYANNKFDIPIKRITDIYLGRQNEENDIENYLKSVNDRYTYEKLSEDEMAKKVAQILANDEVVARCAGKEEWGARALGNRSILCNASHFKNIDILNQYIKDRDFWMPFTPSILKEDIDKYIVNPRKMDVPYMCITFDSTPLAQKHIPAALHPYDHTIRPQSVDKEINPSYHKLLCEFKKLTGISALLNTSFNLHGQPNVSTIEDAIFTLDNSKLKYLATDNFLVIKKE